MLSRLACIGLAVVWAPVQLAAQRSATVYGRVLSDSSELPVPGVMVSLGSTQYRTQSDSLGRYRLSGIPLGHYTVLVRRLGFEPVSSALTIATEDSIEADFLLEPLALALPEVDVTTTVSGRRLRDFYERRRFGIGRFMTEQDLAKAPGHRMSEKLRNLPGLLLLYPRPGFSSEVRVASSRGNQSIMLQPKGPCIAAIMLDGVMVTPPFYVNTLDPGDVTALEWYAGPSTIPAEFNATRNSCALLVIWTK